MDAYCSAFRCGLKGLSGFGPVLDVDLSKDL